MTTVKEFADLLKAELKNLYDALEQQKMALEGNPSIESNTWLLGAAYSLDHQVTDFLTRACDKVEDDPPAPSPEPEVPVNDPMKSIQIGPVLSEVDKPDKKVRIMLERVE
jgi:hypothetical protein